MRTGWTVDAWLSSTMPTWPPATERKGRTPSRTSSTASYVRSGAEGTAWTTSEISGMTSFSRRSRPIFIVIVEEGQVPQAPSSSSRTTGPSIAATLTFPPSDIRYGRSSSRTFSTFSSVKGSSSSSSSSSARRAEPNIVLASSFSSSAARPDGSGSSSSSISPYSSGTTRYPVRCSVALSPLTRNVTRSFPPPRRRSSFD
mmetsp:Transcript_18370/g.57833  ORF Transcript_18370/g.57833 Transcript_18370/m.57833 type:complete len:200 (-) Transcript_18370:215-814(-)